MSRLDELIKELCPDGVEYINLENMAEIGTGRSDRKDSCEDGRYPFYVRSKDILKINNYEYDETAIIIPGEGGIGEIFHYVDGKYALHQRAYRIHVVTDKLNSKYLYYYMFSKFKKFIIQKAVSATVTSIRKPMIQKFPVAVPPLPVQEEIVKILDKFTNDFAELQIELQDEFQARKKQLEYYKEILTDTKGEEFYINELCEVSRGKVISKPYITEHPGEYPVFSSQTENNGELGKIDSYEYEGEFLSWTTDGANAGTVFHREGKFNITNVCGLLKCDSKKILPKYLFYVLNIEAPKHVNAGMGNPKLMSNVMKKIKIKVPSLEEQKHVVDVLDKFDELSTDISLSLPAEIEARQKQYEYYRDKLLTFKEKDA